MAEKWEFAELKQPLSDGDPCGENLEDSQLLASFDSYRLFGQSVPFNPPPDWREIEAKSLEALERSKDFRLLAHFSAAVLRTKGLAPFLSTLVVAAHWLEAYWAQVYPLVDEDAILRKNALNCFADRIAVVDGVRRLPIVRHAQLGSFGLREIEIATGHAPVPEGEEPPDLAQIHAAFAATAADQLVELQSAIDAALTALRSIETKMREEGGSDAAPTLDLLVSQLQQLRRVLGEELGTQPGASQMNTDTQADGGAPNPSTPPLRTAAPGAISSRQDAIRALDAVAAYFRENEPSSPVPLFIERAKRLVGKDFLEVLNDVAPDGVSQARNAGGLRDEE